ncbi:alpha/beta fold hydrolase [Roseomonas sp. GC11]|uniref:alpha/beta fold hydrolase n=1 Tax=Roseomonas sp. GC11 TaxID=2950546 RepID=UPI00210BBC42|nr:alpha/beta fold hydrolase [Roseomonas sp. GC11]MCQ4161840.1 alpha/beta fold hydrolase [Roseomonas sp. GC11]
MSDWPRQQGRYSLGTMQVLKGGWIQDAHLHWRSHGTLSAARDNAILYPTSYGATSTEVDWLIGPQGILDPTRWFIVQIDMFGNGVSSSPYDTPDYPPLVTAYDNVQGQRRLLHDVFGIDRLKAVYGWSMGAQQAYHWAALFPREVEAAIINCGSARTATHNQVFLRAQMAILEAAPEYLGNGQFSEEPRMALRAFGRNYAAWAMSQDFYRAGLYRTAKTPDLSAYLSTWENRYSSKKAANLLAQMRCWDAGDISDNPLYGGNLEDALRAITARVFLLPGETDLYFRVADNEFEKLYLRHASLKPIPSIWGHRAGNPAGQAEDTGFLRRMVTESLE